MGALGVALAIIVVIVIVSLSAFIALRGRQARPPAQQAPNKVHPHAPSYRRQAENIEYYRPGDTREAQAPSSARPETRDLKKGPLPHCPLCDAAVGFDDVRCPKCRHVLKGR